jgi:hypothetical protein
MDYNVYFTIALVSAAILGVCYPLAGFMVLIGFRISRPVIASKTYWLIQYLFAGMFFALGYHYLHLGYFGATEGILPSQQSIGAALANLFQVITLPPVLVIALIVRFKTGPIE